MLMGVNNYSVNEICSHSGGAANELAALHCPDGDGREAEWGRTGCQRGTLRSASTVPPYSRDEVAPSILLAPSKEQAYLAAELMTDGSRRELLSPKRPGPLALKSAD